jgi:thiol-disulfide isomerase/thioredoxin
MRQRTRLFDLALASLIFAAAVLAAPLVRADDPPGPAKPPVSAVLHLADGSFVAGELVASPDPGTLRWQATAFVSPFEFPVNRINAIHWPPPATQPKPDGEFCFELAGGDVVFGSLLGLDGQSAELDVPRVGRFKLRRSSLHRIYRWRGSADLIYLGPNGLTGWHEQVQARTVSTQPVVIGANGQPVTKPEPAPPQRGWREESGQLVTEQEGAAIQGEFGIPDRAAIEFEISWKTKPDFVLALGTSDKDNAVKRAFRFEAWGGDLVVQRELENEADLAVVQEIGPGPGRAHLQAYLDQGNGRLLVFSQNGKQLANLKVGGPKAQALPGLYLANLRGDLRLEWLRISQWSGELPREVKIDQSRIHQSDGTIVYGQVTAFDAGPGEFVIRGPSGESRIARDKISSVFLSMPAEEKPRSIRAVCQDGTRLSGELQKVENGDVVLTVPGIEGSPRVKVAALRSLVLIEHAIDKPLPKDDSTGRLELDGLRLPGRLADGRARKDATCLVWQPLASATASALKPGTSGRIIYKEPPPPAAPITAAPNQQQVMMRAMAVQQRQQQGGAAVALRFASALAEQPADTPKSQEERRSLFLRDGDVIPSTITKITEDGVWFKSSLSKSTFVPHAKVKAIELVPDDPEANTVHLPRSKRERMLMLPRMQKADPPTHLIRSKNGDYLRGRVLKMDDKELEVEVRLETKQIPRDRVSRIIWLHADELDESQQPAPPAATGMAARVQALRNDGVRITFVAEQFASGALSGKSDVLGACLVAVSQIDQLLIGGAIEQAAAQLVYHQWKLKNAPEPKYVTADEGGEGGGDSGTESPLVGKPAPDFQLDLLDGTKFHLADSKGKEMVVLDFWATWCGPCLQAMPQVERAAAEFKDKGVRLVAVNLQETADKVTALLERQKLHVTVALDRDGRVADKYQAVAIPQTVIVNRDGTVARLFVGGGGRLEQTLKDALKALIDGNKPNEPKK